MNKMTPLAAALIAMTGFGLSTTAVADDVENRIMELERQLQELKSQVSSQQQ